MTKATSISWKVDHSIGIPTFDKQHMRLNEILDEFYKSVKSEAEYSKILSSINKLIDYTIFHFDSEEKIMKLHNFPGYELHKMQHEAFIHEITEFEELYKNGQILLTVEITYYIKVWLEIHIDKTDRIYSDYLLAKGVQ